MVHYVYHGETHRSPNFQCERHHQYYLAAQRREGRRGREEEEGREGGSIWMHDHIEEVQ